MLHHASISDSSPSGLVFTPEQIAAKRAAGLAYLQNVADTAFKGPVVADGGLVTSPSKGRVDLTSWLKHDAESGQKRVEFLKRIEQITTHTRYSLGVAYDADGVILDGTQRQMVLTPINPAAPEPAEVGLDLDQSVRDSRRNAYRLQALAGGLASSQRVASCHRLPTGPAGVDVRLAPDGRAYLGGIQTCGSVWMCPVCAKKITEARRSDLQQLSEFTRAGGGQLLMMTLTARHTRDDGLRPLLAGIKSAYRLMVSGKRALSTLLAPYEYLGAVRALEVTVGDNGWHPHMHVLLAVGTALTDEQVKALQAVLFERWQKALLTRGLAEVTEGVGLQLQAGRVSGLDIDPITRYLCKWGVSEELSKLHTKSGKSGRTPWQLLDAYGAGDLHAGQLWQDYRKVFKGSRQLVWSHGLRALVGLGPDVSDEDLAAAEPEQHVIVRQLLKVEWLAVRAVGCRSTLCDLAEYGLSHVERYLADCAVKWDALLARRAAEGKTAPFEEDGPPVPKRMYTRFKGRSRSTVFLRLYGQRIFS